MSCPLFAMLILTSCAQVDGGQRPLRKPPRDKGTVSVVVMNGGNREIRRITFSLPAPPAPDDEDDEQRPVQPVKLDVKTAMIEPENFDRWLFEDEVSERGRYRHLEDILKAKIEDAAREHTLTEPRQAKLRLAGKGDIKRFFDEVEGKRSDFEKDRQTFRAGLAALRRLDPLARIYQDGPFGSGSLFAKTLRRIDDVPNDQH